MVIRSVGALTNCAVVTPAVIAVSKRGIEAEEYMMGGGCVHVVGIRGEMSDEG